MNKTEKLSLSRCMLYFTAWICLLTFTVNIVNGQDNDTIIHVGKNVDPKTKFSLFGSEDPLNVSLSFDITTFLKKRPGTGSLDGVFAVALPENDTIDRKVKIKHRGQYRFRTCGFPPIQLNFKKSLNAYPDTGKIKKIKLVTHCQQGRTYDDYVLREYLVYKLYSVLTDTSFRVRLLNIEYIDTQRDRKPIIQYGFLIEPTEILALRTNSVITKSTHLTQRHIVPAVIDRLAIFSYMVAQWDWAIPGQQNIAVIVPSNFAGTGLGIAVPYDFDLSGLVNASYGFPDAATGLKSNRDRKFAGICRSREEFKKALEEFIILKNSFYKLIDDFPYLEQKSKKDLTLFLDQFYDQLDNPRDTERLIEQFLNSCKPL